VLHVHSGLGRNKVRRDMMRARNRKGFGWTRWSRRWLYITLRLLNRYRVYQVTVTGSTSRRGKLPRHDRSHEH
jgi:hypothetical protein